MCQMATHKFQAQRLILDGNTEKQCLYPIAISIMATCMGVPLCPTPSMVTAAGFQLYHD